jgi:hypothetical protein
MFFCGKSIYTQDQKWISALGMPTISNFDNLQIKNCKMKKIYQFDIVVNCEMYFRNVWNISVIFRCIPLRVRAHMNHLSYLEHVHLICILWHSLISLWVINVFVVEQCLNGATRREVRHGLRLQGNWETLVFLS